MFALRVGKNSRALNDDELRGFFEACDDVDDGASDDATGDDDLDDGSESGEDEAATEFPPVPISVRCPFCADGGEHTPFTGAAGVARHLRTVHGLAFQTMSHMVLLLQRYLDAWAARLKDAPVDEVATRAADDGVAVHCVDAAADQEIRERVQREGLQAVLEAQDAERHSVAREARKCLFCKRVCEDRAALFRHAYREHSFNIGLPDNLVHVNEFLAILEGKLAAQQCLYCEKTFTSAAVLRRHMRKKKHFKISAHNRLYDRFYVVNYLEPGRSWEAIEEENKADSDDARDDAKDESWTDWDERADLPTRSLFDDRLLPSADDCWAYMRAEFGFDIARIRTDHGLDFYTTVSLVNAIRRSTAARACFACGQTFGDGAALADHVRHAGAAHLVPPPSDSPFWSDGPAPVVESDPLLMSLDDDDGSDGECEGKAKDSLRALRKRLDAATLDALAEPDSAPASAQ
ncbi:hypothetical protein IWQ57_001249 [Coemansia nantahalensis]|uniref:Uncharacterized protein n=1 Tax=Coemansia nantahalensis TaxID=2789366 RepID=A0ACC1K4M0_9FUNG|nr:hypothetical protein IWQ57_001249 [Coemansia nantahalensis]